MPKKKKKSAHQKAREEFRKEKESLIEDTSEENNYLVLRDASVDVREYFDGLNARKEPGDNAFFSFFRCKGKPGRNLRAITLTYFIPAPEAD